MHLDLDVGGGPTRPVEERRGLVDAEAHRLAGLGASILSPMAERDHYWVVLQDPEGNEFCVH